jgi:pyruvate/2-oxoglutarate dehydrogenase complex dihydrolipoamide acyltransferase (E2) component
MIHSLVELDITASRRNLRTIKREQKKYLSFTGYIIYCTARAVDRNRTMHAYRNRKRQLVLFEEVDVSTTIERRINGRSEVVALIIRGANKKSVEEISGELRNEKEREVRESEVFRSMKHFLLIPAWFRQLIFRVLDRSPLLMKRRAGTIMVTSANMVGKGAGWGVPIATHTLNVTVGGIAERVVELEQQFETREFLCLTLSFDHNIIDGAPAARFVRDLKKIIEGGEIGL